MKTGVDSKAGCRGGRIARALAWMLLGLGVALMCLNLYGMTQSIRRPGLGVDDHAQLRFVPKEVWSYEMSLSEIDRLKQLAGDRTTVVEQANQVVNRSIIHPEWNKVDPVEYRQLIPAWENYFLFLIGRFSGLSQFERYHYSDYRRSIQRGIGLCGDASTVMSSVLDELGIENRIVSFKGHVIVEYEGDNGVWRLADPDFGVLLRADLAELTGKPSIVAADYLNAGYSRREVDSLMRSYATPYALFDDTYHFMSMRYVFERVSYVLKWVLPVLLMLPALIICLRRLGGRTTKVDSSS